MAFDREIAGYTICAEASGEPYEGKVGVAASLFNRLKSGRFGKTIAAVCLQRYQYSEWNDDKGDNGNLLRVATMKDDDPAMLECLRAYDAAAGGSDPSGGATHYLRFDANPKPKWVATGTLTVRLGAHEFYKGVA